MNCTVAVAIEGVLRVRQTVLGGRRQSLGPLEPLRVSGHEAGAEQGDVRLHGCPTPLAKPPVGPRTRHAVVATRSARRTSSCGTRSGIPYKIRYSTPCIMKCLSP